MANTLPFRKPPADDPPAPLHARAMDNLAYIRSTMEHAATFTAVSGWGMVAAGVLAGITAIVAASQPTLQGWLSVWLAAGAMALIIQLWALLAKARAAGVSVLTGHGRKFVLAFSPPILVGAVLTVVLFRADLVAPIPAMWLLVYGAAVTAGGAFSVDIVPVMGISFLVAGVVAVLTPLHWNDWILAIAFGGFHIAFGIPIARRYGG